MGADPLGHFPSAGIHRANIGDIGAGKERIGAAAVFDTGCSAVSNPTLIGNVIFILLKNPAHALPFFVK